MPKKCVLCQGSYGHCGISSLHALPTEPTRRKRWLEMLQLPEDFVSLKTFICNRHFKATDFTEIPNRRRQRLNPNSIPRQHNIPKVLEAKPIEFIDVAGISLGAKQSDQQYLMIQTTDFMNEEEDILPDGSKSSEHLVKTEPTAQAAFLKEEHEYNENALKDEPIQHINEHFIKTEPS